MTSDKFRRQLRQEAEQWWHSGLIDAALYDQLAQRYRFDRLENEARNRFTTILISLGGILLGLGAITFVAANWSVWSRTEKLALLLSVFLSVNIIGFWLWRSRDRGGGHKLGAALLLLGGLMLGANVGLVSQMFHQSGPLYELLYVWSGGVWVMAIALRMPALSILSVLLAGCAYFPASFDVPWTETLDIWQRVTIHLPLLTLLLFAPLARLSRSGVTFCLTGLLLSVSVVGNILIWPTWANLCACTLPPALLWGYSNYSSPPWLPAFSAIAHRLTLIYLAALFYLLSFRSWGWFRPNQAEAGWDWRWQIALGLIGLTALALWLWLRPRDRWQRWQFWRQPLALNSGSIGVMLLVTAAILSFLYAPHWSELAPELAELLFGRLSLVTVAFNVLFFGLAIATIRDSLALGSRPAFWGGTILLVLGIATRMLEYNTDLLLKAFVLSACGIGVILGGLWFERHIQAENAPRQFAPLTPTPNSHET
ncbi:MAG: DUF2157 domain-containing protein [Spirulinaceae cyanobacterium SM2_1_0]|nr:DUF2157 domain-containing protein [Spirulinaceae cyanobacterium SM2_1_0]